MVSDGDREVDGDTRRIDKCSIRKTIKGVHTSKISLSHDSHRKRPHSPPKERQTKRNQPKARYDVFHEAQSPETTPKPNRPT